MSTSQTPAAGNKTWFHGTGRRKESIARVFVRAGSGKFTVNGRSFFAASNLYETDASGNVTNWGSLGASPTTPSSPTTCSTPRSA